MSPQFDDGFRPHRPRSNTSSFTPFAWRRGRPETVSTPAAGPSTAPTSLDALIEALTPPTVPSLTNARALSAALAAKTPFPRLAIISPVLASLCSETSPPSFQAAGYDILASYWEHAGSAVLTTGDRISCLSLFLNPSVSWSAEVWEPRFKALDSIIHSGAETVGMEGSLLNVLRSWIEGAFEGLARRDTASSEERTERQRSVEVLTAFLTSLVGKPEFVSRLSEQDTTEVLNLWTRLIDRALLVPADYLPLISPSLSPVQDPRVSSSTSPRRLSLSHRRHHSSTSLPQMVSPKHPADIVVDAYLTYLETRLKALAPTYLQTILPLLFRASAFYATPLPRVSLTPNTPHESAIEKRIAMTLRSLVTGPYSSSCTILLKRYMLPSGANYQASVQTSVGALRTLRTSIRELLMSRLARAYITRASSVEYSPAGVPTRVDLERELMERAWSRDETASWDLIRFRSVLCRAVKSWIEKDQDGSTAVIGTPKEEVLLEVSGILKDVVQALDERGENEEADDEEINSIGDVLRELISYLYAKSLTTRSKDGAPIMLSLSHADETSPFLNVVSTLLAHESMPMPLYSVLPSIILSMAEHVSDVDIASLLETMWERQSLSPTSPTWLEQWKSILTIPYLYTSARPMTRQIAVRVLESVWEFVRDIPIYRRPLASLVYNLWKEQTRSAMEDVTVTIIWHILGDEVVLRSTEGQDANESEDRLYAAGILEYLGDIARTKRDDFDDAASIKTTDMPGTASSSAFPPVTTATASPVLSRAQSDFVPNQRESSLPLMSLLSSFTGNSSRSQSQPRQPPEPTPPVASPPIPADLPPMPKTVGAVVAMISIFSQLAFTPLVLVESNTRLAVRVFDTLVDLLSAAECVRARLTVLQFLMRLRSDRDHRLYYAGTDYDKDGNIATLASLINRAPLASPTDHPHVEQEMRTARPRVPQERNGRKASRGRGGQPAKVESRSRSRTAPRLAHTPASLRRARPRDPMWSLPETLPFTVADVDSPSEGIISYDPSGPRQGMVLPFSRYLTQLVEILKSEREWEILSYALCHLPTQLSNKHLVCGPKSRVLLGQMVTTICAGISEGDFAMSVERWPDTIIPRDAHGLVYHTLTVLISYKRCFPDPQTQHHLVEVLLLGLSGQPSTIKCCLHALALSTFELQPSTTKYLSRILEKLSQIMSNPSMAVHIIELLSIVGSVPEVHTNFTEEDYKMVFAVALQYLQYHNHPDESVPMSWALSQHVRIMSYYIVYLWFLAVPLPDRPRHVAFISRQLLLANEGQNEVDEPAEVCFDWLARYTYASADPRPANSMLNEFVTNPQLQQDPEPVFSEKTWVAGSAVITMRALMRRGWIEVVSRRASGLSKFLCRAENVPIVPIGDVDPDLNGVAASVTLDRGVQYSSSTLARERLPRGERGPIVREVQETINGWDEARPDVPPPDPITGYIWSGTAPSQRRKEVAIDPSFFALQLSSYPANLPTKMRLITDKRQLSTFVRNLDYKPVVDTHAVGILYVAPGQKHEREILQNRHGSPAYSRFLEGLGRLINLRGQVDVYAGGLDPDEDGEYAYAWWNDIGQIFYHTATLMPTQDEQCNNKKRYIGNDFVRIVWNDSGMPYKFDTLATQFQFVNIVIEPHSRGAIAAFSNNLHENEYFKVTVQRAPGMTEFTPIGDFKLISAENLPPIVRQLSLLADWFVSIFSKTNGDTERVEIVTNWRARLQAIKKFRAQMFPDDVGGEPSLAETRRDFTTVY